MNISLLSLLERCKNFLDFFSYQNYTSVRIQMGNSVLIFRNFGTISIRRLFEKLKRKRKSYATLDALDGA